MNMNFFSIFDVIIGVLGLYLVYTGIKSYKKGEVDPMMITSEELTRCSDLEGLSKFLMPKCAVFGGFCVLFGAQGLLNDAKVVEFSKSVNIGFLIAFVVVWVIFSYFIRKAKKEFIKY
ncbi:hypothetical protein SAMN02910298_00070 [Pseudobutyrivibrio sp. YE44]|uniref:hypothetical protein n=1 Tax=Pseudobutyrivibrio sp. YE44 TaxID=1520802 RepID=UPI0008849E46|nr:hypothetical protein [Pseudobutyrivibrio sp. YE44]SDB04883.1 hypothetical protein SAMN02910298_00070 [Pseudobutyrivibrio sp. YE44]